jgi:citrate synthase
LGIPDDLFIPIFAMGRIAGWTAHIIEQYVNNRLIRPRALYVGERGKKYVPLKERG